MNRNSTARMLGLATILLFAAGSVLAYPSLFTSRCVSCHSDDSVTCDGCHNHRGNLNALADQATYLPGESVGITLNGGDEGGWIRARLYDENDLLVDLATGPTGTGDDGGAGDVTFPVSLAGVAPIAPGTYVWEAAWFGSNNSGSGHLEVRDAVTIVVESDGTGVPESEWGFSSWQDLKALY